MMINTRKDENRVRGALYGVAVGDALGAPLEFLSADEIKAQYGCVREMIGGGWLGLQPGEVTDDTQMTLCVARGIVERPDDPVPAIRQNFMEWFEAGPSAAKRYGWDRALEVALRGYGDRIEGNGALMRTIYPPLFYGMDHSPFTASIARITHPGPVSMTLCVTYGDLVALFIQEGNRLGKEYVEFKRGAQPTGYVLDSYNVAMECFADTKSFEEGLIDAVNRGGDADTIGAIYGGIAGAFYGYDAIPERCIRNLESNPCEELDQLANIAYKAHI